MTDCGEGNSGYPIERIVECGPFCGFVLYLLLRSSIIVCSCETFSAIDVNKGHFESVNGLRNTRFCWYFPYCWSHVTKTYCHGIMMLVLGMTQYVNAPMAVMVMKKKYTLLWKWNHFVETHCQSPNLLQSILKLLVSSWTIGKEKIQGLLLVYLKLPFKVVPEWCSNIQ